MVTINEKIKNIRIEKNIKQSEVARSANIKQPSYASIENGKTKSISIEVGKGIAKALGVSFNELFEIESTDIYDINELKEKIKILDGENAILKERLRDKNKLTIYYEDTAKYLQLFMKYAAEIMLENDDISALELLERVENRIRKENGQFTFTFSDIGVRFHFLSPEEEKILEIAIKKNDPSKSK